MNLRPDLEGSNPPANERMPAVGSEHAAKEANPSENGFYQQTLRRAERSVDRNPKASMLVPLALGLGAGLLIGFVSSGSNRRRDSDEWFSRRTLDRLVERLPDALGKHLHS